MAPSAARFLDRPQRRRTLDVETLVAGIRAGDRTVLARAITLVESRHPEDEALAEILLDRLLPATGASERIGITGAPGVGKSTFVDAFGSFLTARGHRVAVLAVDPSSQRTGGSILGDKTRMARLAADPNAFIRPSPSAGTLGGVARTTRETMLLCEAAGYDIVIVETVGVGQSETVVADMVDIFVALLLPGAGDELQGIKKGLVELADLVVVNKADGALREAAEQTARQYGSALRILEPASPVWRPPVLTASAKEGRGIAEVWAEIERHRRVLEASGERAARRRAQQVRWFHALLEDRLMALLRRDPSFDELLPALETAVAEGRLAAPAAVSRLLAAVGFAPPPSTVRPRVRSTEREPEADRTNA
ncbi:MAG: methylmalonyl Co-A mutase-associated GTPase MeaB [Geminicoccaceae bacterium]|nr:methylmalonyl Co-A mutase-associated GTPase MeaB [Geminicoccaceae bacterium]MDW8340404.1 methylmalonyl Co-A mutase-associated GTPase MeaB [Geminicoccaceae bacterium]